MAGRGCGNFRRASSAWACARNMCACAPSRPDVDCCAAASNSHSPCAEKGLAFVQPMLELPMAVVHHHDRPLHETNRCAAMFCLTWVGFFVAIGVFTYLVSML